MLGVLGGQIMVDWYLLSIVQLMNPYSLSGNFRELLLNPLANMFVSLMRLGGKLTKIRGNS